jgi:biopolymer transport protein ExbD
MRRHSMPEIKESGVNVTPLIDIVMCLIIFFMLVAKIGVTSGADPNIKPPVTILGNKIEDMGNTVTLNVRDWETWYREQVEAAQKAGVEPPTEPTALEKQRPRVTAMLGSGKASEPIDLVAGGGASHPLREELSAALERNPTLRVIIRADRDIRYELLQQILKECSLAKGKHGERVKDFNFETTKAGA